MPKGNPSPQTLSTEKYQKKAGYMVKSFKVKREVVEKFERACIEKGISQAAWLTNEMNKFIEEVEASK